MPYKECLVALVTQDVVGDATGLSSGAISLDRRLVVPDRVRR